jgi:hypothetical protein
MASLASSDFIVWGIDQAAYGPIELPTLVSWIKDERVMSETWLYVGRSSSWQKAGDVPELQMFFRSKGGAAAGAGAAMQPVKGIDPRTLRRVKILANLTDDQLARFAEFMEVERVPQFAVIVKQGDHGNTMFLILEGELRVRITTMGKETILTTLSIGDFFGDISLFDHGPRSADVVANSDSVLLKISSDAFNNLSK